MNSIIMIYFALNDWHVVRIPDSLPRSNLPYRMSTLPINIICAVFSVNSINLLIWFQIIVVVFFEPIRSRLDISYKKLCYIKIFCNWLQKGIVHDKTWLFEILVWYVSRLLRFFAKKNFNYLSTKKSRSKSNLFAVVSQLLHSSQFSSSQYFFCSKLNKRFTQLANLLSKDVIRKEKGIKTIELSLHNTSETSIVEIYLCMYLLTTSMK